MVQEMHGKECEGRFLGVKLDEYGELPAKRDRPEVDMDQETLPGSRRTDRPSRSSTSHKGRQVSVQKIKCKKHKIK